MTESEWLTCEKSPVMLEFLRGKVTDRKLRLFACHCCWRHRDLLVGEASTALAIAERLAEGGVRPDQRKTAKRAVLDAGWHPDPKTAHRRGPAKSCVVAALDRRPINAAIASDRLGRHVGALSGTWDVTSYEPTDASKRLALRVWEEVERQQLAIHAGIIRDIFGNPFRPVAFDPRWRTETAVALATGIYEERAFDRMPILADALEDAGCDHADILNHCRGDGPHVRGCWVVDLVLGKE